MSRFRAPVTMGSADGVIIALGLVVSLEGQPGPLFHAARGAGLAELVGMTAAQWLADERAGIWPALANGAAACLACICPVLPYLAGGGWPELASSLVLVCAVAGVIAILRPERGVLAFVQTYGILLAAAALCWLASLA